MFRCVGRLTDGFRVLSRSEREEEKYSGSASWTLRRTWNMRRDFLLKSSRVVTLLSQRSLPKERKEDDRTDLCNLCLQRSTPWCPYIIKCSECAALGLSVFLCACEHQRQWSEQLQPVMLSDINGDVQVPEEPPLSETQCPVSAVPVP